MLMHLVAVGTVFPGSTVRQSGAQLRHGLAAKKDHLAALIDLHNLIKLRQVEIDEARTVGETIVGRRIEAADVAHQLLFTPLAMVINLNTICFIENIDIEAVIVTGIFKEELNNPFTGVAINRRRQPGLIAFTFSDSPCSLLFEIAP